MAIENLTEGLINQERTLRTANLKNFRDYYNIYEEYIDKRNDVSKFLFGFDDDRYSPPIFTAGLFSFLKEYADEAMIIGDCKLEKGVIDSIEDYGGEHFFPKDTDSPEDLDLAIDWKFSVEKDLILLMGAEDSGTISAQNFYVINRNFFNCEIHDSENDIVSFCVNDSGEIHAVSENSNYYVYDKNFNLEKTYDFDSILYDNFGIHFTFGKIIFNNFDNNYYIILNDGSQVYILKYNGFSSNDIINYDLWKIEEIDGIKIEEINKFYFGEQTNKFYYLGINDEDKKIFGSFVWRKLGIPIKMPHEDTLDFYLEKNDNFVFLLIRKEQESIIEKRWVYYIGMVDNSFHLNGDLDLIEDLQKIQFDPVLFEYVLPNQIKSMLNTFTLIPSTLETKTSFILFKKIKGDGHLLRSCPPDVEHFAFRFMRKPWKYNISNLPFDISVKNDFFYWEEKCYTHLNSIKVLNYNEESFPSYAIGAKISGNKYDAICVFCSYTDIRTWYTSPASPGYIYGSFLQCYHWNGMTWSLQNNPVDIGNSFNPIFFNKCGLDLSYGIGHPDSVGSVKQCFFGYFGTYVNKELDKIYGNWYYQYLHVNEEFHDLWHTDRTLGYFRNVGDDDNLPLYNNVYFIGIENFDIIGNTLSSYLINYFWHFYGEQGGSPGEIYKSFSMFLYQRWDGISWSHCFKDYSCLGEEYEYISQIYLVNDNYDKIGDEEKSVFARVGEAAGINNLFFYDYKEETSTPSEIEPPISDWSGGGGNPVVDQRAEFGMIGDSQRVLIFGGRVDGSSVLSTPLLKTSEIKIEDKVYTLDIGSNLLIGIKGCYYAGSLDDYLVAGDWRGNFVQQQVFNGETWQISNSFPAKSAGGFIPKIDANGRYDRAIALCCEGMDFACGKVGVFTTSSPNASFVFEEETLYYMSNYIVLKNIFDKIKNFGDLYEYISIESQNFSVFNGHPYYDKEKYPHITDIPGFGVDDNSILSNILYYDIDTSFRYSFLSLIKDALNYDDLIKCKMIKALYYGEYDGIKTQHERSYKDVLLSQYSNHEYMYDGRNEFINQHKKYIYDLTSPESSHLYDKHIVNSDDFYSSEYSPQFGSPFDINFAYYDYNGNNYEIQSLIDSLSDTNMSANISILNELNEAFKYRYVDIVANVLFDFDEYNGDYSDYYIQEKRQWRSILKTWLNNLIDKKTGIINTLIELEKTLKNVKKDIEKSEISLMELLGSPENSFWIEQTNITKITRLPVYDNKTQAILALGIMLTWNPVFHATKYEVYRKTITEANLSYAESDNNEWDDMYKITTIELNENENQVKTYYVDYSVTTKEEYIYRIKIISEASTEKDKRYYSDYTTFSKQSDVVKIDENTGEYKIIENCYVKTPEGEGLIGF